MIEVQAVTKTYGETSALDGVSFTADKGEVIALLGANGAGKTTLLKCLLGLIRFEGAARIGTLDVSRRGKEARRLIGYLPQVSAFPAHLTAGDALEYYADLRGLRGEPIDARLQQLGLGAHADKRVTALSGGLRQRLGIATALLGDPPVLIFDEPLASLDPEGRQLFCDLIEELKEQGRTVLLSTHVFKLLNLVTTRALVLEAGRVAYDGSLDGLLARGGRERRLVATLTKGEVELAYTALLRADVPPGAITIEGPEISEALASVRGEVSA